MTIIIRLISYKLVLNHQSEVVQYKTYGIHIISKIFWNNRNMQLPINIYDLSIGYLLTVFWLVGDWAEINCYHLVIIKKVLGTGWQMVGTFLNDFSQTVTMNTKYLHGMFCIWKRHWD